MQDDAFSRLHPGVQYHLANTLRWDGLRPTQAQSVGPILDGDDTLVIAPTAGGKTEAAIFPLLSVMATEEWQGVSVLYVCPLRALLNNLQPRLHQYCQWLGRSSAVWHGDVGQSARKRILLDRPDVLLTTPESLEAMLVSTKVDSRVLFSGLRAVVVDEIHAFAGDDRGWHLLAVLERLSRVAGREVQRIGLSATVGNPEELLGWLQGSFIERTRSVVAPSAPVAAIAPDITVDHVGSLDNAATVIAALHQGEKRLVFVDSRRRAEELGSALRERGVQTFLSHSSLSAAERRRSEEAFADSRDTVIVATSTLELGIDVGDLDRVIQIGAPRTVASFLQRLGRTGRRSGTLRNCLFLCVDEDAVLSALGMLECWSRGWVEPVTPPPSPRHIAAQQLMALCLQEHRIGVNRWREWWGTLPVFDETAPDILEFFCAEGYFERDGDFLHIGPEAERRFGRRYFSDLTAVFSAPPEFLVLAGQAEVGTVGTDLLIEEVEGPRVLLLGGRSWKVTHIDWQRRRCFVEPVDSGGRAKWSGLGGGVSFEIARGMRTVLLGSDPGGVTLTRRSVNVLMDLRTSYADAVDADRLVLALPSESAGRWWTWAGTAANRSLQASLPGLVDPRQRFDEQSLRLLPGVTVAEVSNALASPEWRPPEVNRNAVTGLKFSAALPPGLAESTVAERLGDLAHAKTVSAETRIIRK
ncbi:DEAD/DEAH box helicase [Rhodococcus sp. BP-252]|uniref:DEAD/DEAH box helicase n=1 Tax=unclassified Rhodococcus (in: high G+C Gram-positive bacteria) TaxID=192944 RepID=UPI001C9B523E|nr:MULTISPECIES: DEAD/DEAH box helicase [unclassified Rhodococcus (in: high G+C Gram-positive bacteria)]MBY6413360.1 DEAD/DEAH box helicase [Rhodococcus sp. BP-320]MBY6418036.1 DEAD/DEAH box helicase [Rhodococcus sp. BP-321]MBY6422274.1 DEAD/DEAH box helicase [Rhodococcus sp. BP-324]MBY6428085.1 DEAD/DEAH box helicase [Rhodococcus sp. BP-323]MBY6433281.1 DEAD/DEAH box helicase [Rhodococcus sp. BP-322]